MKTITLRSPHGPRGATRRVQDIRRVSIDGNRLTYWCVSGMSSGIVLDQMTGPVTLEVGK